MIKQFNIGSTLVAMSEINALTSSSRRRHECEVVRSILDKIIGSDAALDHDATGAPRIKGVNVSISHSRKLAVVAIDPYNPVGIDAEEWRPTLARVKAKFLSPSELNLFSSSVQLLRAWTIKEAVYKIAGPESVDFANSISINSLMNRAAFRDQKFEIFTLDHGETFISLAKQYK